MYVKTDFVMNFKTDAIFDYSAPSSHPISFIFTPLLLRCVYFGKGLDAVIVLQSHQHFHGNSKEIFAFGLLFLSSIDRNHLIENLSSELEI